MLSTGLYGLTPLLADVRGILTRYGWINDLLNIIDAPLENFINANYVPLPQVRGARRRAPSTSTTTTVVTMF